MDYKTDLASRLDSLRNIEGFPIGKDEDILALSDPPHFTACPNPYIAEFIEKHGKPYDESTDTYHREPFVADVSEGRGDPFLNAHFYHTKVPPKAIEKFIQHYTKAGDIVFDGFCGTGTTGIAASSLNRKVILSDLSPIATFIAYNQTAKFDAVNFIDAFKEIYSQVLQEFGWVYETNFTNPAGEKVKAKINYVIWSDFFSCPFCKTEFNLWDKTVDFANDKIAPTFKCNSCNAELTKNECERVYEKKYDEIIGEDFEIPKQNPILISFVVQGKKRFKYADDEDLENLKKIEDAHFSNWVPSNLMMFKGEEWGDLWRQYHRGYSRVHRFYTKRNLFVLGAIYQRIQTQRDPRLKNALLFLFTSLYSRTHRMNRYIPEHGRHVGPLSGTLYLSNFQVEINVLTIFDEKFKSIGKIIGKLQKNSIVSLQSVSSANKLIPKNSIDYIFTDPPFGDNLPYSELNFILEAWLKVHTQNLSEAVINSSQGKDLEIYRKLMIDAFKVYYQVLKPKRWITIVFHNSKSAVWIAIQEAINKAGFIISNVAILDKKKGTTKQMSYSGAVKNDLVITAYKPAHHFEESFLSKAGEGMEAAFIEQFLTMQPVQPILERTEKMLYSKMLAYYIQHGYEVRYDARSFYKMLSERFAQEDGYWFSAGQINSYVEYRKRMQLEGMGEVRQGSMHLFVSDERSALAWLFQYLAEPKSFSDILTAFNQIASIQDDQVPEIKELLEENFVHFDGRYRRPRTEPEHDELTTRRERALLREFEGLLLQAQSGKGKIKSVRKEAVLYGFEQRYKQKRYSEILELAKRLNRGILDASPELSEFVEAAEIAVGGV